MLLHLESKKRINFKSDLITTLTNINADGNLALSRAIGDRSERPFVSNIADISKRSIDEHADSFLVLATDGLFDVMTSQEVVDFIRDTMTNAKEEERELVRKDVAKMVAEEALDRGSLDNITVLVMWINDRC